MPRLNPYFATRRRIKVGLTVAGIAAGVVFGLAISVFGKIIAGAPPATLGNYAWNASVFAIIAGVVSPMTTWSTLRRAPLWRTVVEPLGLGVVGGAVGVMTGSAALFLALPPLGILLGIAHLSRTYPKGPTPLWALSGSSETLPTNER